MDLLEEIKRDHQYLRDLLNDLCNATDGEGRSRNYGNAVQRVMAHEQAEEETLYDALLRFSAARDDAESALKVHRAIKDMVRHIQETTPDNVQWQPRVCQLREVAFSHMDVEEEKIIPHATNLLASTDLDLLGRQYVSVMDALKEIVPLQNR